MSYRSFCPVLLQCCFKKKCNFASLEVGRGEWWSEGRIGFRASRQGVFYSWERGEGFPSGIGSAKQLKILKEK